MIVLVGLAIFIVAMVVGMVGVLANGGTGHELPSDSFTVLGYHVTGSTGILFLCGILVGVSGLIGLSVLLAGARRSSTRGTRARNELRESRRETAAVSRERDAIADQRANAARANAGGRHDRDDRDDSVRRVSHGGDRRFSGLFRRRSVDGSTADAAHGGRT
ncbi:MAG: hypothetical protein LLG14_07280 [Nocardiaceae bacterium]|nr:hypothetical protein [Nocardiaceae bacterium]